MRSLSEIAFLKAPNGFLTAQKCFLIIPELRLRKVLWVDSRVDSMDVTNWTWAFLKDWGEDLGKPSGRKQRETVVETLTTLPVMLEQPKRTSGLQFSPMLKTFIYSPWWLGGRLLVRRSLWASLMIFIKVLQQKFQPGLCNFPPYHLTRLLPCSDLSFQIFLWLNTRGSPLDLERAWGQTLDRCQQCRLSPSLEPAALACRKESC